MIKDFVKTIFMPVDALLSRIAAIMGAVCIAQFPNFIVLYLQRLGGHLDELKLIINQYQIAAQATGKNLQEYIAIHTSSKVPEIAKTGEIIQTSLERFSSLKVSYDAIFEATPVMKFLTFIRHIDFSIAKATMDSYTFGVPFDRVGLIYAAAGMIIGMLMYYLLKKLVQKFIEPIFSRKASDRGSDIVYK